MSDREQAIELALRVFSGVALEAYAVPADVVEALHHDLATQIVDAILGPVHEAAREVVDAFDGYVPVRHALLLRALRAALFAERVPTPITDEQVERMADWLCTFSCLTFDPKIMPPGRQIEEAQRKWRHEARAALDAALNGGK